MNNIKLKIIFILVVVVLLSAPFNYSLAAADNNTASSTNNTLGEFAYAKSAIKQKAEDVARQIEIYLDGNPDKTVADLQADDYFQKIAVQPVGQTGYTAVTDYDSLVCRFHKNPKIINLDLHALADKLPGFWEIMSKTKGGQAADGIYDWQEADGSIKQKYMYIAIVPARTADDVGFSVAATTYLDEYQSPAKIGQTKNLFKEPAPESAQPVNLLNWLVGILAGLFLTIFILNKVHLVKLEKNSILLFLITSVFIIIVLFVVETHQTASKIKQNELDSFLKQEEILSEHSANMISRDINAIIDNARIIAQSQDLLDNPALVKNLLERMKERIGTDLENIILVDQIGNVIAQAPQNLEKKEKYDFSQVPGAKQALENRRMLMSAPREDEKKNLILSVVLPIKNKQEVLIVNILLNNIFSRGFNLIERTENGIIKAGLVINGKIYRLDNFALSAEIKNKIAQGEAGVIKEYFRQDLKNNTAEKNSLVYFPVKVGNSYWAVLLTAPQKEVLNSIASNINRIWYFTIGIIISFIVVGFIFNFLVTKSLKKEVAVQTAALLVDKQKIQEQLEREEKISSEKEKLLVEREKAKKELEDKIKELEKFQKLTVGRELKMIKLKKKIAEIENKKD